MNPTFIKEEKEPNPFDVGNKLILRDNHHNSDIIQLPKIAVQSFRQYFSTRLANYLHAGTIGTAIYIFLKTIFGVYKNFKQLLQLRNNPLNLLKHLLSSEFKAIKIFSLLFVLRAVTTFFTNYKTYVYPLLELEKAEVTHTQEALDMRPNWDVRQCEPKSTIVGNYRLRISNLPHHVSTVTDYYQPHKMSIHSFTYLPDWLSHQLEPDELPLAAYILGMTHSFKQSVLLCPQMFNDALSLKHRWSGDRRARLMRNMEGAKYYPTDPGLLLSQGEDVFRNTAACALTVLNKEDSTYFELRNF